MSPMIPAMDLKSLTHYIRTYDANLRPDLCEKLIGSFHAMERFQKRNGRGVRAGLEHSGWSELNVTRLSDAGFLGMFRQIIDAALARYNQDVRLAIPVPNSPRFSDLVMKRYRPGGQDRFQLHFDAVNHLANRYLVLLWYLNDVAEGGETAFPQLEVRVPTKTGRLLVFPPYWMYQHEGLPPRLGDKYILSTYLMFEDPKTAAPDPKAAAPVPRPA
jgi:prolyl 4-hydroxylase